MQSSFTEKMIEHGWLKCAMKVVMSAGGGLVLGAGMAMMMSSFEFNSTMGIDTDRSGRSQLKQHFHGYSRFLKRQSLHWAKFGLYITLLDIPLELIVGRPSIPASFVSGGLAAAMQTRYRGFA